MPTILRWFLRLGPTNPIAVRLVQNGSRRVRHLYIRSAYLAVLIVVLLWSLLVQAGQGGPMSYRALAEAGAQSFIYVAFLQIALICILAPVFMAGAIAQEANPQTWDILLTTPLRPIQIVLGNLFGRLFFIVALLVASLPLFALTQYFGGVPGRSIFASYLIAVCAALLVGAIAITLSVSRLAGRRAVFTFYVCVVGFLAVTLAADWLIRQSGGGAGPRGDGVTWMTAINPFLALRALLYPSSYPRAEAGSFSGMAAWFLENPVTTWVVGSVLLSLVLVGASTATVHSGGLAQTIRGGSGSGGVPWYRRMLGLGAKGSEFRPPRAVWTNPIAWREATARNATLGRMAARWSFIAIGGLFGVGLVAMYHGGALAPDRLRQLLLATVWGELAVISLVAINMAATAISREREDGTLDLLLTTPITQSMYISGKLRGLVAYVLPMLMVPIGTLLAAGLYVLAGGFGGSAAVEVTTTPWGSTAPITTPLVLPEAGVIAALVVIPFIAFCVMIGLQWSLGSKGTLGAVVATVGVVGLVAGVISLCGWNAAADVQALGPVLAALSPASAIYALVEPADAMRRTIDGGTLTGARVALFVGALIAAGGYLMIVYGLHAHIVKNFDATVRKLAGTK